MPSSKLPIWFLFSILLSCDTEQRSPYVNLLVGDWTLIKNDSSKVTQRHKEGYSFLDNGVCHNKLGYFRETQTRIPGMEKATGNSIEETNISYLGTETRYKIKGDSLLVFNLNDIAWEGRRILRLANDTLVLQSSNQAISTFTRSQLKLDTTTLFDELVVSSVTNKTIIKQSGEAIYFGLDHNNSRGSFSFSITKAEFKQIESSFKLARIDSLKNEYSSDWTDQHEITMTFIKEGKIIKNIRDYGSVASTELYWAYMPVYNMYQLKKLDSLEVVHSIFKDPTTIMIHFQLGLGFSRSETFYLWNLLRQARESKNLPSKANEIDLYGTGNIRISRTDGRLYRFVTSDGSDKTFDIGFNFFDRNGLTGNLKPNEIIKKWEEIRKNHGASISTSNKEE